MNVIGQIQDPFMMGRTLVGSVACWPRLCSPILPKTETSFGKYLEVSRLHCWYISLRFWLWFFTEYIMILVTQVLSRLRNVSFLCSRLRKWLAGGNRTTQVPWALSCISEQEETAMADLYRSSCSWVLIWVLVFAGGIIWGAWGKGELGEALAKVQGGYCTIWPCPQLWKNMPYLPGTNPLERNLHLL